MIRGLGVVLGGNLVKGETLVKRKLMLLLKERWYSCFKKSNQGNGQVLCDPCQTSRLRADDPSPWTPSKVFNFLTTFLLDEIFQNRPPGISFSTWTTFTTT